MKIFTPRDNSKSTDEREKDVLEFWNENDIFQKSIEQRSKDDMYTFYDGPPFATGMPHYGHLVGNTIKDVVPRYWTMQGKRVPRVWGWDCHGLPIENIVEKEFGSKSKKDIEELGVAKFNEACRSKVLEYAHEWERIIPRVGRWADMKNPYRTMDKDFMESVWWVFKTIYDKGLVYEDYRTMHICPRCETTLSQSEVTEGYADVKDLAVTAKFELVDEPGTYVLAWTTTPWTLPGNVALAVGEDIAYSKVRHDDAQYIVATNRLADVFGEKEYEVVEELQAKDLLGRAYKPLWEYYADDDHLKNRENGWKIYAADFIDDESGTGIAHEAPAFGAEDMELGKVHDLPWVQHVAMNGRMKDAVTDFAGLHVKPLEDHLATDVVIIKNLAQKGLLFHKEKYTHSYPHCWRCDTPLLNYATSSWFVRVEDQKEALLANAEGIHWSPGHIKKGRWGKWLEGARDWSISRQRFWASVMPVWRCDHESCDAQEVFGSAADLEERVGTTVDDLHKHVVDELTYDCQACDGTMRRIPDVLDTWFDSGSMPYAQKHYPFEHKDDFEQNFPADFIAEGVDQTRCWFYYMHVLSQSVRGTRAFDNVVVNGIVQAEDGKKMSKKLQNYPDLEETVAEYGADALRLYLLSSPVVAAEQLNFTEKDLSEIARGLLRMLAQSQGFFLMYAAVDGWTPTAGVPQSTQVLDRWIVARLQELIQEVTACMERYDLQKATRAFGPFVDDLSNWYIRRSRKRFWKTEDDHDKEQAYATLHYVLVACVKTLAPFAPFITEEIYRSLTDDKESVHLEDFPVADTTLIDQELLIEMQAVRDVITEGLRLRAQQKIKVRQPLASVTIAQDTLMAYADILCEELNVKEVLVDGGQKDLVVIDSVITEALRREGQAREVVRGVQQARKKAGYSVEDRIVLGYVGMDTVVAAHEAMIAHEVLATELRAEAIDNADYTDTITIDGETLEIFLRRVQ